MQDNRALQAGTSHFLGQNFAKAFDTKYQTTSGELEYVWSTSWGVSTRLLGGLILTHSDDNGWVCTPRLAPVQVVIVPIWKTDTERQAVTQTSQGVMQSLKKAGMRVILDDRDGVKPGAKYYEWEGRGVPIRLEVGPRDVSQGQAMLARRTGGKTAIRLAEIEGAVRATLDNFQKELLDNARARREQNSIRRVTRQQLIDFMEGAGGFAYGGFCGGEECEMAIKDATKATVRVLPDQEFRSKPAPTKCVWCDRPAITEAVWAKAY
jgi:prolyl-tRNA synthetase